MATSTSQSIWRSGGGDTTKTAYAGTMVMTAQFYIANVAATSRNVQISATNTGPVILPIGAVISDIFIASTTSTGGTSPTIDIGYKLYNTGTASTQALANESASDSRSTVNLNSNAAGTSLGIPMSATEMVYLTAGVGASAATSGVVTGFVQYSVPTDGQYTA